MLAIVLICVAASAAFVLLFIMEVAPGRNPLMAQRLSEMQAADQDAPATTAHGVLDENMLLLHGGAGRRGASG